MNAQISLQEKLALIQGLPRIIEQAVKPMQSIDSIRIMQVDGLNAGAAGAQSGDAAPAAASGEGVACVSGARDSARAETVMTPQQI